MCCPGEQISKQITKGCPQGSICGPIFWDITMGELLQGLDNMNISAVNIAYADDLLVLIAGNSRPELEQKAQNINTQLLNWCNTRKLKISSEKSTYLIMKGSFKRDPTIRLNDKTVRRSKSVRYLGITISERLQYREHIEQVCSRAKTTMHMLSRLPQRDYRFPLHIIRGYMTAIMTSIVGYGSSVWAEKAKQIKPRNKLNSTQRGVLVALTGATRTTSADALQVIAGVLPMDLEVLKRAAEYWLRKGEIGKMDALINMRANSKVQIRNRIHDMWQTRWDDSEKGRRVHHLLPNIEERLQMKYFSPSPGLVHYITGHGPYTEYLYNHGLSETNICNCGETGTPEHVMFHCTALQGVTAQQRLALAEADIRNILHDETSNKILNGLARIIHTTTINGYLQSRITG
ncbi:Reverse transcriptase (RNA-dependent DNA polymerase) [Popillia japonica]|uniref:Reverse transcriptase (RNA-dependent DNA polymerase) n=1 Tax=Popillia japonica TaxID=7064 RepID=A0AAW1MNQ4_POPJA